MKNHPPIEDLLARTRKVIQSKSEEEQKPPGSVLSERILAARRVDGSPRSSMMTVERLSFAGAAFSVCLALVSSFFEPASGDQNISDLWMEISEESP